MKTKLLMILLICSALLLTACNNKSTYEQMQEQLEGNNYTMQGTNEEEQEPTEEQELIPEETGESGSGTPNTMKRCSGEMAGTSYLIYLSDKNAYEKVMSGNGGKVYTWLTQFQTCALTEPSNVPKKCFELSQGEYNQHYLSMQQLTEEPMASIMGIKCSNVPYDESVFIE